MFNEIDVDHNIQTSQKYIISYKCFMCQSSLESQLNVLQHITDCAPDYAKHLGLDDPSLVSNLSDSTPTDVDTLSLLMTRIGLLVRVRVVLGNL